MFTNICDVKRMLQNAHGISFVRDIQHFTTNDMNEIIKADKSTLFYGKFNDEMQTEFGQLRLFSYPNASPLLFKTCLPSNFDYQFTGFKIVVSEIEKIIPKTVNDFILLKIQDERQVMQSYKDFVIYDNMSKTSYPLRSNENGEAKFYYNDINQSNIMSVLLIAEHNNSN
ncbi:MAG TPA: hypothetical protein EYO76_02485, partial [Flavobacteriaceae bacterium]|nr:hypothetical protein [Flavobacteriaceae bacterium]